MKEFFPEIVEIFKKNNGVLRVSEVEKKGVSRNIVYAMLREGLLVKQERGLYRLADLEPLGSPDLIQASLLIPKAVVCLISALHFHNLTTQIPHEVYLCLPKGVKKPRIQYPPVVFVWQSEKSYSAGISEYRLDGIPIKIYNREKTVVDCFKFRSKTGNDVAIEALKDYLHQPKPDIAALFRYARIDRVENIIRSYIKALI